VPPLCKKTVAKPSATMQGLMSGVYEGVGLGVGSLLGGFLIDKLSATAIWQIAGFFSAGLVVFNLVIESIKYFVRRQNRSSLQ